MKKQKNGARLLAALLCAAALLCLAACGEKSKAEPITLTLWHVYGGEVDSPLNPLIEEFNDTVGREQGISVEVTSVTNSVTNSGTIHDNVLSAAYQDPGAPALPDLFVSYPKTVLALPDEDVLVDYRDYFTDSGVAFGPAFERAWEPYARAALQGELWLGSGYATEPLRTGDAIASVASSASVLYYSDIVTYSDNTSEQVEIVSLPCPIFENGEKLVMQRGVGMCAVKSTPEREKACMTFLKWLNEPKRNVDLTTAMGYIPVTKQGFDEYLPAAVSTLENPMYVSLYEAFLQTRQEYRFYVPPQREDYLDLETRFEKLARLKLTAGQTQLQEQGPEAVDTLVRTTLASFRESYEK